MKTKSLLLVFFTTSLLGFSQPTIEWEKSLGGSNHDSAYSMQQTSDGGYIIVGSSMSNDGDVTDNQGGSDYWVVKLSITGSLQWQKSLGGDLFEWAHSTKQTTDGGYVILGESYSNNGDVSGNNGESDYWIVKLSSTGVLQWEKTLGGSGIDSGQSIQQTSDGGYIVAGFSASNDGDVTNNHGSEDYWVVKLSTTGDIQWEKTLGGSSYDLATSIQQTSEGGYIVAGMSSSNNGDVSGNHGNLDYWIVKLNSTGNIVWQKSLGGTEADKARSIQQTSDGGFIVAGQSRSNDGDVTGNHGYEDYWVVKLSSIGVIEWERSLGGSNQEIAYSIVQTLGGDFSVVGYSESNDGDVTGNHGDSDIWIAKLSSTGSLLWQKSLGGSELEFGEAIIQTTGYSFVVAGTSRSNDGDVTGNHGASDFWIVKLSPDLGVSDNEFINTTVLYPNPSSGSVNIETEDIKTVTLFDSVGKKSYFKELTGESSVNINVSHLAKGVYMVVILTSKQRLVKKLIIK